MARTAGIVLDLFARTERHRYGPHRRQRADLHVPRDGEGPYPLVVLIHGGSWRAHYGKIVMKPLAADLVRRGFATWNIEYRRIGRREGGGWPETFDDVVAALDYVAELDDPRLDLDDVTLLGHSAGGHLALWAASRGGESQLVPRRVIALAPVTNLVRARDTATALMRCAPEDDPERWASCDPIQLLPVGVPLLVVHGEADLTVPVARSREYVEAACAAGDDAELIEPVPGGHRVQIDPRSAGWRAAAEWLEANLKTGSGSVFRKRSTSPRVAR